MKHFEVQTPFIFLNDFLKDSQRANQRIWIQTMNFDPGMHIEKIAYFLLKAAKNKIDVRINVDWIAQVFYQGRFDFIPILSPHRLRSVHDFNKKRQGMYQQLINAGVQITTTNEPRFLKFLFPAFRRNHIKMFIIDQHLAWIGGINLMDYSFYNHDLMIKVAQPQIVKALAQQFIKVNKARATLDYRVNCDVVTDLLIDVGNIGRSLILDQAHLLIIKARKEIIFVSQLVPDFSTLKAICEAAKNKNIKVHVITSNIEDEILDAFPYKLLYRIFKSKTKNIPTITLHHLKNKVHIKALIVDSKKVMIGSHNLSNVGVWLGTEELMFLSDSKQLVSDLRNHIVEDLKIKLD